MSHAARRAHAERLVRAHHPADAEEAGHRDAILALLAQGERGADVFSRAHYTPGHLTASAFVVDAALRDVLLIWHLKLERWLQPGGHVEPDDEDVVAAAAREIAEETGLHGCHALGEGLFDVDVHRIPARGGARPEPEHEHHDLRVALVAPQGSEPVVGDGVGAFRWVPLDAFDALVANGELHTDRSVMRAIERLRARLER
jgi:8-oxo-dGTP pyrophosphatase MutT (NUDIX family)